MLTPVDSLEERVLEFTARELGITMPKLSLSVRLLDDLGLDGDDAIEFFEAFSRAFAVDLEPLYQSWSVHFNPEGGPPLGLVLGSLLIESLTLFVAIWIDLRIGRLFAVVWFAGLIAVWGFIFHLWPLNWKVPNLVPISAQDLVDAAEAGRWVKAS